MRRRRSVVHVTFLIFEVRSNGYERQQVAKQYPRRSKVRQRIL